MRRGPFDRSLSLSCLLPSTLSGPKCFRPICVFPASAPRPVISPRSSVLLSRERLLALLLLLLFPLIIKKKMHVFGAPGLVCSTWDLYFRHVGSSSLIRDPTWGSCIGTQPLITREAPTGVEFLIKYLVYWKALSTPMDIFYQGV